MKTFTLDEYEIWGVHMNKTLHEAAVKALREAANRTVTHIKTVTIPNTPNEVGGDVKFEPASSGDYKAAWRVKEIENGAEIRNDSPYAAHIEYGVKNVKPGKKFREAIIEWLQAKQIQWAELDPQGKPTGNAMSYESMAFVIGQFLKKTGIFNKGKGMRVLERANKMIPQFIQDAVDEEFGKL